MKISLNISKNTPLNIDLNSYDEELDNYQSILFHICEFIKQDDFSMSGFGNNSWIAMPTCEMLILIEELPIVLQDLRLKKIHDNRFF